MCRLVMYEVIVCYGIVLSHNKIIDHISKRHFSHVPSNRVLAVNDGAQKGKRSSSCYFRFEGHSGSG